MIPNFLDCLTQEEIEKKDAEIIGCYSGKSLFSKNNENYLFCRLDSGKSEWAKVNKSLFEKYSEIKKTQNNIFARVSITSTQFINRGEVLAKIPKRGLDVDFIYAKP